VTFSATFRRSLPRCHHLQVGPTHRRHRTPTRRLRRDRWRPRKREARKRAARKKDRRRRKSRDSDGTTQLLPVMFFFFFFRVSFTGSAGECQQQLPCTHTSCPSDGTLPLIHKPQPTREQPHLKSFCTSSQPIRTKMHFVLDSKHTPRFATHDAHLFFGDAGLIARLHAGLRQECTRTGAQDWTNQSEPNPHLQQVHRRAARDR
jgi:hypothetical protein